MRLRKVATPMGIRSFNDMINEFFRRYDVKDYAGALEILNRGAADFPEQASIIAYNQACMLNVQNMPAEALAVLHQAADKGCWFQASMFHQDSDFASLLGNPEFEALVTRFQAAYDVQQARTFTTRLTIEPANSASKPYPLLLALHGNQSNATLTSKDWQAAAKLGWQVGALQSSQIGYSANIFSWDDQTRSLREIEQHRVELMRAGQV